MSGLSPHAGGSINGRPGLAHQDQSHFTSSLPPASIRMARLARRRFVDQPWISRDAIGPRGDHLGHRRRRGLGNRPGKEPAQLQASEVVQPRVRSPFLAVLIVGRPSCLRSPSAADPPWPGAEAIRRSSGADPLDSAAEAPTRQGLPVSFRASSCLARARRDTSSRDTSVAFHDNDSEIARYLMRSSSREN